MILLYLIDIKNTPIINLKCKPSWTGIRATGPVGIQVSFIEQVFAQITGMFPGILWWVVVPLIPYIVLEQLRPVGEAPRFRNYWMNIMVVLSTACLALPAGLAAGLWSTQVHKWLPWDRLSLSFNSIGQIPFVGSGLEILAMIFIPLFVHDFWFYWAHRLEHKVPVLWEFHKIHHSDERMSAATFGRDNFMQQVWRTFFSIFTLGLIFDIDMTQAGKAALYSNMFLIGLSMFYHSAIRVQAPWMDRLLVTPQVHRLHHSTDPAHYNKNFSDALPLFDIVFGTYRKPIRDEFPATGLKDFPEPRSLWMAQFGPLAAIARMLRPKRREQVLESNR